MADIPDQPVGRGIEHVMQRDGELDDAHAGAEMTPGMGGGVDGFGPQLLGELAQLPGFQFAQIRRIVNCIEQENGGSLGHCRVT